MTGPGSLLQRLRDRGHRAAEARYWDEFVNRPPYDALNCLVPSIRLAPEGSVNSVRSELHSAEIMSGHVREIAKKLGGDAVGIVSPAASKEAPEWATAVVLPLVRAEQDPETSPGIGGQVPVQRGLMVSFILAAYFREAGYRATTASHPQPVLAELAAKAGLGVLDRRGRLVTKALASKVWVADAIYTDFPLECD